MTRKLMDNYVQETGESQALVESNLHRAADLINSFKKVAVEQTSDSLDEIVFHDYLRDVIASVEPRLNDNQVVIELISDGDWMIKTYPGAWWQVLSNLIENSLSHGFLNQSSGVITVSAQLQSGKLVLTYRDDGCGMDAATLEKLYEPFYTTTRKHGNTGLGMHIVYNLVVQQLGGSICCHSKLGQGVEFVICIEAVLIS